MKTNLLFCIALVFGTLGLANTLSAQSLSEDELKNFQAREVGPSATGGRIVDIAVNPKNPYHIFAAAASGGLFETKNNGTTWQCIFQNEGTLSIGDVAVDPSNVKNIWVGTGEANNQRSSLWGDGIYKTEDGGKTWKNMGLKDSHHIGRIIVDPKDSNVVYVAALGHLYSFNEERGLFKTTDGGKTWKKVLYVDEKTGVVDVVIDPTDSNTLYAASYQRLRRAWNFDGAGPGSAIYKTTDGGKSWTKMSGGLPTGNIGRIGLAIYPQNPKVVYASVSNQNPVPARSSTTGSRQSLSAKDQESPATSPGSEWNPVFYHEQESETQESAADKKSTASSKSDVAQDDSIPTPFGMALDSKAEGVMVGTVDRRGPAYAAGVRTGMQVVTFGGVAAKDKKQLVAFVKNLKPGDRAALVCKTDSETKTFNLQMVAQRARPVRRARTIGGEVYKTTDAGKSWKKMNRRAAGGSPAYYYGQIRVDPNDENQLYMLSVPVYVSKDGGKNWATNGATSVHVDHHAFWINPDNSDHLLLGNDGGFHVSYDRGKTWDHVFNLNLAQFYAIGVDMQKPYHVYGGLQDNGTWGGPNRSRGGSGVGKFDWYRVGGGDGFYVQPDPTDHNIVYGESQFGVIYRVNKKTGERRSIRPPQSEPGGARDRYNWNSPIMISKHNTNVIYFAGNKLFRSDDQGNHWETISPDLTTADKDKISGNVPHCTITTLAESALDRNMLLVGTDDGKVQWTNDGGKSWIDMSDRMPYRPKNWWCSRVELSHHDKKVAYATFTGYREDDFRPFVFKTVDGGETWSSISNGLPNESVNVLKEDQYNKNLLFLGTEMSAYASLDAGKTWFEFNGGMPRASVQDMVIHPRDSDLILGTHGRGMFIIDDISALQQLDDKAMEQPAIVFKPRTAFSYGFGFGGGSISGNRKWVARNPSRGGKIWYYVSEKAKGKKLSLKIFDVHGREMASYKPKTTPGIHAQSFSFGGQVRGRGFGRGGQQSRSTRLRPGTYSIEFSVDDKKQRVPLVIEAS